MPEPTATPTPETLANAAPEPKTDPVQGNPDEAVLGDAGKQAIDRMKAERNEAVKQAADMKKQLDKINQANESAVEKAQREATEASNKVAEYERQILVQKVALEKGVPAAHIHRLSGKTEAELATDADELMAALNTPGTPKPDPSQGAKGSKPGSGDPAQDFANFLGSQMGN